MENQNIKDNPIPFNIYKQLKGNIKHPNENCKDFLSDQSLYCFKCRSSTCPDCSLEKHTDHQSISKVDYYINDVKLLNSHFQDIENLFNLNPDYLNIKLIRGELMIVVDTELKNIKNTIESICRNKMEEINSLFETGEKNVESLKKNVKLTKNLLSQFFNNNRHFFSFEKDDEICDYCNTGFLLKYDLLQQISEKNKEIKSIVSEIKDSCTKYTSEFKSKIQLVKNYLESLNLNSNSILPYSRLNNDFYFEVVDKIAKYNQMIKQMQQNVYETVLKKGEYSDIERLNIIYEVKNKQNIDNILNCLEDNSVSNEVLKTDKPQADSVDYHQKSQFQSSSEKKLNRSFTNNDYKLSKKPSVRIESPEVVTLSLPVLKQHFTYLTFELLEKYYHKPKIELAISDCCMEDEEIEIAKPVCGTNEMIIYDRKTQVLTKKKVQLDKKKHKYSYFLNGSRWVVVKDYLYITGGIDNEKKEATVCFAYSIKTNDITQISDMENSHAYHAIYYLENYNSIIVIGGEKNASCELYDLYKHKWISLPSLNYPRANCCIYFDRIKCCIYAFFGVSGEMFHSNIYSDLIEIIQLKKTMNGWKKLKVKNKADIDFKISFCRLFPIDYDRLLIYGASGGRDSKKKAGIFVFQKKEIVKIDSTTFNEIRLQAKKSAKLTKIISTITK